MGKNLSFFLCVCLCCGPNTIDPLLTMAKKSGIIEEEVFLHLSPSIISKHRKDKKQPDDDDDDDDDDSR